MAMLRSGSWVALLPFQRCAADNCELQFADVIVVSCYLSLVFCLKKKNRPSDQQTKRTFQASRRPPNYAARQAERAAARARSAVGKHAERLGPRAPAASGCRHGFAFVFKAARLLMCRSHCVVEAVSLHVLVFIIYKSKNLGVVFLRESVTLNNRYNIPCHLYRDGCQY